MIWRGSLARRVAVRVSAGFALIWLLAVFATALVLKSEQDEMLDLELRQAAGILHQIVANAYRQGLIDADTAFLEALFKPDGGLDEALVFALVDPTGEVLVISPGAERIDLPQPPPGEGTFRTRAHAFITTPPDETGLSLHFGDPLAERREAYLDSLAAFLVPMLTIVPLGYLLVISIVRSSLRPLRQLEAQIEHRGDAHLDPIDASGQPEELRRITATLNGFMIRLAQALEGERSFATNAAHELRSPVAVALAQVQRLRSETTDAAALDRIARLETALQRMRALVARLLQLARAESGVGKTAEPQDVGQLLTLVIEEAAGTPAQKARIRMTRPESPAMSSIDPDAFAIVSGNLVENALQHSPPASPIDVRLTGDLTLVVTNEGDVIAPEVLARLTERFRSAGRSGTGFGLGLYISERIARQAGGALQLHSPPCGRTSGFEAVFLLPRTKS